MLDPRIRLVAAVAAVFGCTPKSGETERPGRTKGSPIVQPFPSEQELDAIARTAPAPAPAGLAPAAATEWTMDGPLPDVFGESAYTGTEPDDAIVRAALHGNQRLDTGMMCLARQHGRFLIQHEGMPPSDIDAFMRARCGAAVADLAGRHFKMPGAVPPLTEDVAAEQLAALPPDTPVGYWIGGDDSGGAAVFLAGLSPATVEPMPFQNVQGHIDVEATLAFPISNLTAYASWGDLDARPCEPLPTKSEVQVALRCPVDPSREFSYVEVYAAPPGRLLANRVLGFLASTNAAPDHYSAPPLELPLTAEQTDSVALVTGINAVRERKGIGPLTLSKAQSEAIAGLVPHQLSANTDPQTANTIALGIMAGWQVDGTIQHGQFLIATDSAALSIERSLAGLLLFPAHRRLLLSPDADVVATADHDLLDGAVRATLVSTYKLFEAEDHTEHLTALFDEIDRQRISIEREPVTRIGGPQSMKLVSRHTQSLQEGKTDPGQTLDRLLEDLVEQYNRPFAAMLYAPLILDGWRPEFPEDLLAAESPEVVLAIGWFQPEGQAWGQYTVFLIYTAD